MENAVIYTGIGTICISGTENLVTDISVYKRSKKIPKQSHSTTVQQAAQEITEYLEGKRRTFTFPFAAQNGTLFERSVWEALTKIPHGETRTYAEIAAAIGKPGAVRAVGTAIGKNPLLIVVPCHRVIRSDGTLSGFALGIACKKQLLHIENIAV